MWCYVLIWVRVKEEDRSTTGRCEDNYVLRCKWKDQINTSMYSLKLRREIKPGEDELQMILPL